MEYIFVLLAVLSVWTCVCQTNDLCQLRGYNLEPLTKSYWAVQLEKVLCPNTTDSCMLLFALCYSSELCPREAFACIAQNGKTLSVGGEAKIEERKDADGFNLYFSIPSDRTEITNIEFTCDAENSFDDTPQNLYVGSLKAQSMTRLSNETHVLIKDAIACKKREGLGPGSQFMIILLVLFLLYFGAGIVYNHVNGARGEELIPHHWFWRNLPSYIVDGCIFVVRVITCQARDSYSQNPDYGSTSQAGVSPSGRTYETL